MTTASSGPRFVSITEAARILEKSRTTVYRWIRDGELHTTRRYGRLCLTADELDRFLRRDES